MTGVQTCALPILQTLRAQRHLPRVVVLVDGDNELVVDLDNVLACDMFAHLVRSRRRAVLCELFPDPDELVVRGPEGHFIGQIAVSFVRQSKAPDLSLPDRRDQADPPNQPDRPDQPIRRGLPRRRFIPGSQWLYIKLYAGTASADQVLCDTIAPFCRQAIASGAAQSWFFIRYRDPHPHLRVRWRGEEDQLRQGIFANLARILSPLCDSGLVWRVQLDTYEREIERYGGFAGIEAAEQFFCIDSEAVVDMLEPLSGDEGADLRWRLAVLGTDRLLDDLGLDLAEKHILVQNAKNALGREFHADTSFLKQLGRKFRTERAILEDMLQRVSRADAANGADAARLVERPTDLPAGTEPPEYRDSFAYDDPLDAGIAALDRRSRRMDAIRARLRRAEEDGQLTAPITGIAWSYVHMYVNRLLRSAQRAQELVIYDWLRRLYESQLAKHKRMVSERG